MTMLLIAADRCTGCRMCELACSLVKEGAFNPDKSRIWIEFEGMPELFHPNACRSCGKPPCTDACPTEPKSIYRDEKVGGGMKIL
ncbi:4Fe-4S dicluster domain-containing protein, partial [Candidatus Bathyarchaeota archaeon]